jgi:hypothetical protein
LIEKRLINQLNYLNEFITKAIQVYGTETKSMQAAMLLNDAMKKEL